nr:unnamed protein product [Digitaria exilis]
MLHLKEEMEIRKQMNMSELNDLEEDTRVEIEGFRTGTYVRLEVHGVPFELVEHFDPCHPILVGGIGLGEENTGYMQASLKRHRWHRKVLKTKDPIIVSIGWRRFQTTPVYAIEDRNGRHRMLKYTPEHMHCFAMFWGPLAPPKSGVLAVQNLSNNQAAKIEPGDVLKRKGEYTEGIARCTFEDRILMSDIVFLRAWVNVEVPTYCNLVTTALQPRKETWQGMRTTAELRRAHNIPIPHNKDSVYKPIERKPRKFNPVEIPAKLQQLLPFKSKPKDRPKQRQPTVENRVPVIMEHNERKTHEAIRQLMLLRHEKAKKKKIKEQQKKKAYEAEKAKTEQVTKKRQREERRERYREEDKQKKRARR